MSFSSRTRDQLIKDIEIKFTDYLRVHNQNVYGEFNAFNQRLTHSTNEVAKYQAELMVASQEDEGATIRIKELERRGAIMEDGPRRIHQRGMEIQEGVQGRSISSTRTFGQHRIKIATDAV